jgi:hypothetical protein
LNNFERIEHNILYDPLEKPIIASYLIILLISHYVTHFCVCYIYKTWNIRENEGLSKREYINPIEKDNYRVYPEVFVGHCLAEMIQPYSKMEYKDPYKEGLPRSFCRPVMIQPYSKMEYKDPYKEGLPRSFCRPVNPEHYFFMTPLTKAIKKIYSKPFDLLFMNQYFERSENIISL